MGMSNIKCAGCGAEKPPEAYPKRSGRQTRRGICRACLRSRKRLRASDEEHEQSSESQALNGEQAAAWERKADANESAVKASRAASSEADSHEDEADASALSAAEDAVDEAVESDVEPKRKRKRKRRRGKRAKKKAVLDAGMDEAADPQSSSDGEAAIDTERYDDTDNEDFDAIDDEAAPGEPSEMDITTEQEPGKRKRKRKRRRRSKKSASVNVSGIIDDEAGESADHAQTFNNESSFSEPSNPDLTDNAQEGFALLTEEDNSSKRKRKRKRRRRKGKRGTESEATVTEAEAPKRPAVRPPNKRIVPFKGPFTYNPVILNDKGTGMIRLRGRRETGKRWHTEIEKDIAVRMVQEGAAGIIHPRLIHKLYTKSDFRLLILQRDNYVCRYCGQFGDTIDHVMPKSKGGLSSPMNCVCACSDCNLLKADKLDFPYPDDPDDDAEE